MTASRPLNLLLFLLCVDSAWAQVARPAATNVQCICDAATKRADGEVVLRGTAGPTRDGLVLVDYTCPAAQTNEQVLPLLILVNVSGFASDADRDLYAAKQSLRLKGGQAVLQMVARGRLQCKRPLRFRTNEQGEFLEGDGFGTHGLIKCRLQKAHILVMRDIE